MTPIMKLVIGTLFLTTLIGCGVEESSELKSIDDATPLFITIGGRQSCGSSDVSRKSSPYGMTMFRPAEALRKTLSSENGVDSQFIYTCYRSGGVSIASSFDEEVIYGLSDQEALSYMVEKKNMVTTEKVIVTGHSYGGWLAMKLMGEASTDAEVQTFKSNHVFTIDPISRVNCSFTQPSGCWDAPADILSDERQDISSNSTDWINFWQDRTIYLHASAIDHADNNLKINRSHIGIETDDFVWSKIQNSVVGAL